MIRASNAHLAQTERGRSDGTRAFLPSQWLYVHESDLSPTEVAAALPQKGVAYDPMQFIYLKLIGKVQVTVGSDSIRMTLDKCLEPALDGSPVQQDEPMLVRGDQIQLSGVMYTVESVKDLTVTIDRPFEWPDTPAEVAAELNKERYLRRLSNSDLLPRLSGRPTLSSLGMEQERAHLADGPAEDCQARPRPATAHAQPAGRRDHTQRH